MALNSAGFIAIAVTFALLACVAYGLRFWARTATKAKVSVDDVLIIPALIGVVGIAITMIIGNRLGKMARHHSVPFGPKGPIYTDTLRLYQICDYVVKTLTTSSLGCSRLSVLFFYRRIFSIHKRFLWFNTSMIVVVILWLIAFFWATIFQCKDPAELWNSFPRDKPNCVKSQPFYYAICITGFLSDLIVLASPIPLILKLKMPIRTRIAVICILQLGIVVCVAGILRFVVIVNIAHGAAAHIEDITYFTAPVFIWCIIESSLAVVGANLPLLRPITLQETSPWPLLRSYMSQLSRRRGSATTNQPNGEASDGGSAAVSIELTSSISGAKHHTEESLV